MAAKILSKPKSQKAKKVVPAAVISEILALVHEACNKACQAADRLNSARYHLERLTVGPAGDIVGYREGKQ